MIASVPPGRSGWRMRASARRLVQRGAGGDEVERGGLERAKSSLRRHSVSGAGSPRERDAFRVGVDGGDVGDEGAQPASESAFAAAMQSNTNFSSSQLSNDLGTLRSLRRPSVATPGSAAGRDAAPQTMSAGISDRRHYTHRQYGTNGFKDNGTTGTTEAGQGSPSCIAWRMHRQPRSARTRGTLLST